MEEGGAKNSQNQFEVKSDRYVVVKFVVSYRHTFGVKLLLKNWAV